MWENTDKKNSEYGHFSHSAALQKFYMCVYFFILNPGVNGGASININLIFFTFIFLLLLNNVQKQLKEIELQKFNQRWMDRIIGYLCQYFFLPRARSFRFYVIFTSW